MQAGEAPGESSNEVIHIAAFRAAVRTFLRRSELIAREHKLTPQRHLLLLMIKGSPDGTERATVTELGERLQLAQSTVTELAKRAERAGLIRREGSDSDGRVTYLHLTPEGEVRLAGTMRDLEAERAELLRAVEVELDAESAPGG